ncbi:hypothetical protein DXA78_09205 [Bacteroides fragilis]|nr:hypothetical protein DXA81_15710 [Bacteroides fragilis]RGP12858.1 hypothetical protein DXA78_09205 [Bacteroides fragilis]
MCHNSFHHGVSQSLLLIINNLKSPLCYSVSSVVSFDSLFSLILCSRFSHISKDQTNFLGRK